MQQTWINEIPTALSGAKARAAFSDFHGSGAFALQSGEPVEVPLGDRTQYPL